MDLKENGKLIEGPKFDHENRMTISEYMKMAGEYQLRYNNQEGGNEGLGGGGPKHLQIL